MGTNKSLVKSSLRCTSTQAGWGGEFPIVGGDFGSRILSIHSFFVSVLKMSLYVIVLYLPCAGLITYRLKGNPRADTVPGDREGRVCEK